MIGSAISDHGILGNLDGDGTGVVDEARDLESVRSLPGTCYSWIENWNSPR